jgi:hypothetical protein
MSDDQLEVAVLQTFLRDVDFSPIDTLECATLQRDSVGYDKATTIRRLGAFYDVIRAEFPNIRVSRPVMDLLVEAAMERFAAGPFTFAWESSMAGWYGQVGDVVAAAHLGSEGELETVLSAMTLLSHGYDYFGGDGRPLIDGYRYLIPSAASYTSALNSVVLEPAKRLPGWWDQEGYGPQPIEPDLLSRAVNVRLTDEQRRAAVGLVHGSQCLPYSFYFAATALGMDVGFMDEYDLHEGVQQFELTIEDLLSVEPGDPDILERFTESAHLACLMAIHVDHLLNDAETVSVTDLSACDALQSRHKWITNWERGSWRVAEAWPDGPIRDVIRNSEWELFNDYLPTLD